MADNNFAITDIGTQLYMLKEGSLQYTKLVDIVSAPATGGSPTTLEGTVLVSKRVQKKQGRLDTPDMEFGFNYTEENLALAQAAETGQVEQFLLIYGDGSGVKIEGQAVVWVESVDRNSIVEGRIAIAAEDVEYIGATALALIADVEGYDDKEEAHTRVAYTPTTSVAEIDPSKISFNDGKFRVPLSVDEFTFVDGVKDMKAKWNDTTKVWDFTQTN